MSNSEVAILSNTTTSTTAIDTTADVANTIITKKRNGLSLHGNKKKKTKKTKSNMLIQESEDIELLPSIDKENETGNCNNSLQIV